MATESLLKALSELADAAIEAVRATLTHEDAPTPAPTCDESCENAKERLRLAHIALAAHTRELDAARQRIEVLTEIADRNARDLAIERDRVDRIRAEIDDAPRIGINSSAHRVWIPLDVIEEALANVCPDQGVCHHACVANHCWRVRNASPISGVFSNNEWPEDVKS